MEIMYPIVIIICFILGLTICIIKFNNKIKYTTGKKVANTKYIKETEYYKRKMKKYKFLANSIKFFSVLCIIISSMLIARIVTIKTKNGEKYNRDILLGLDISTSECEVNLELIKKFKEIIPSIEGDRIGIIIFNTAPIVYSPLTDDYDYIKERLDIIEEQLKLVVENNGNIPISYSDDNINTYTFWYGGTLANNQERGSSLIGDGLARNYILISRFKK